MNGQRRSNRERERKKRHKSSDKAIGEKKSSENSSGKTRGRDVISEDSRVITIFHGSKIVEKRSYILRAAEVRSSDGQRRVRRDDVRPRYVKFPRSLPTPPPFPSDLPPAPHRLSPLLRFHVHTERERERGALEGAAVCWWSGVGRVVVVVPSQSPEAPSDGWQR